MDLKMILWIILDKEKKMNKLYGIKHILYVELL